MAPVEEHLLGTSVPYIVSLGGRLTRSAIASRLISKKLVPGQAASGPAEAVARGRAQLAAARAQLSGPAAVLDALADV